MNLTEYLLDESLEPIKVEESRLDEKFMGFGQKGTIQVFGNDIIITDASDRSISITKKDAVDLVKVLYNYLK